MPFIPPADLPPPALVQTVSTATPDEATPRSDPSDRAATSSHQGRPDPAAFSAPEALTRPVQFSDIASVIRATDVPSLAASATQAQFLQAEPISAPLGLEEASAPPSQRNFASIRAPWVSQLGDRDAAPDAENVPNPPPPDQAPQTDTNSDEDEVVEGDDPESSTTLDEEEDGPVYPRAATPERDWSNGAVVDGALLTPTQPTNRPPTPLNLTADYQEFEPQTQVLTARGMWCYGWATAF